MIFYDIECFYHDWIIVFKIDDSFVVIHNDYDKLTDFINNYKKSIFIGFNNYRYDDIVLAGLLMKKNPYTITKKIIGDRVHVNYKLNLITLDVIQEIKLGLGLKSCQANLGMDIVETPVNFSINRFLTDEELKQVIDYCKNDVKSTELLFKIRIDYFQAKFEIIKEFSLPIEYVKKTRANLSSKVLKCNIKSTYKDRLHISYDTNIDFNKIPIEVIEFFKHAEYDYCCGRTYEEIEKRKLKINIDNVPYVVGFGGLHGAIEKYTDSGTFLQIDVSSYYPSLMINNHFISRNSEEPEIYKSLMLKRFELKQKKDPKQKIYKILLNATFGAMKSTYNALFDPTMANNICVNGQLILIQLIQELLPFCKIIQANTDGIIVKYQNNYSTIQSIVNDFGKRFNLSFDIDKIVKIAQRDVNNYAVMFENGEIKAKGRFAKFQTGSYEQNTLTIIDKALVNYYLYDVSIVDTIMECYRDNNLLPFQIICKMGNSYDAMYYEYGCEDNTEYIETQKVNRVFATKDINYWGIYKRKGTSYQKIANTSIHNVIHNDDISTFDKTKLDLDYYVRLCTKNLY